MCTARIVTDAGKAYIKAMGNPQSPHLLAIELIATRLAQWFKLPVLDHALVRIDSEVDEIPFLRGGTAASGPAFVTRAITAHPWGGSADELKTLVNPEDIGRLVVFDTWVRNCDRYSQNLTSTRINYDNVMLEELDGSDAGNLRLIAMDHTHCFTCGGDLDSTVNHIDRVKDDSVYGLFPGFVSCVRQLDVDAAIADLSKLDVSFISSVVHELPDEWEVPRAAQVALRDVIVQRAGFVVQTLTPKLAATCWPGKLFDA